VTNLAKPIVFDSEALARAIVWDPYYRKIIIDAHNAKLPVVISAASLVEVTYPKINKPGLDWIVSRLDVIPVTKDIAKVASQLLASAKMHGHQHAIDAMVCATAFALGRKAYIYTSDPNDFHLLTGSRVSIIAVR